MNKYLTDQEVFEKFKELGYKVDWNVDRVLFLKIYNADNMFLFYEDMTYSSNCNEISMTEHLLLYRLFVIWEWINEETIQ